MKILLVSSSFFPKVDGSTRCVYDHARKLAARGNYVFLSTRGVPGAQKRQFLEGFHVKRSSVSFRSGSVLTKALLLLDQIIAVMQLQREKHFDVIHVHGYISGLAALPCRYIFRVPIVITTHGTELLWPKNLWWKSTTEVKLGLLFERFVLNHCDVVIAQSPGVGKYMLNIYGPAVGRRIRIVHTGVDHVKFAAPELTSAATQVLFVGALSEIKGVTCLLKAFASAHQMVPDTRLVLVGSGPNAEQYRNLAKSLQLGESVVFRGPIRDDGKLVEVYRGSDVVVLPSNVGGPISCTLMEGLSCGRAVISTDVPGGIPDILAGGVGLLIEREDQALLSTLLFRLMTDPKFLEGLGKNARKTVEEKYTLESMVDKLTVLYSELAR